MRVDIAVLKSIQMFSGLSEEELDCIRSLATPREVPAGSTVFEQGAAATHFFLLAGGRLKVTQVTTDGQQIIVRMVHPGDMFGFAKALRRDDYPGTAISVTDSSILAWPTGLWNTMIDRWPALAASALLTIGQRLEEAHTRIREMSTQEAERRIAHTLLRLCRHAGRTEADGILIDFPLTRQDLAEMTGTTLHYVSRIVSAWEARGIIRSGRQKVLVTGPEQLRLIALSGRE